MFGTAYHREKECYKPLTGRRDDVEIKDYPTLFFPKTAVLREE